MKTLRLSATTAPTRNQTRNHRTTICSTSTCTSTSISTSTNTSTNTQSRVRNSYFIFSHSFLLPALALPVPPIPQGNNKPFLVSGTPCASWEQAQASLIALGVPHHELGQWQDLYLWDDIRSALQTGWDPREEIEKYLTPFFHYLGDRKFRCVAPVGNGPQGAVCGWEGTKKDRTISHICGHFGYNAYICNGECGRPGW
jgi:hypothetical protein